MSKSKVDELFRVYWKDGSYIDSWYETEVASLILNRFSITGRSCVTRVCKVDAQGNVLRKLDTVWEVRLQERSKKRRSK